METGHYTNKSDKLEKSLNIYLKRIEKFLIPRYGQTTSEAIIINSKNHYPSIIPQIPFVKTPMYDSLLVLNSRMMALKKGMKDEGIGVEEFVSLQINHLRSQTDNIPQIIKKLMDKIYLSSLMRIMIKKVGKSATNNGWPTEVIDGKKGDDFSMKITTKNCQMVNFMCAVGEDDIKPYCTFADFTTAETLGLGLKQISSIDSGTCAYCFSKKGKTEWPDAIQNILTNSGVQA